MRYWTAKELNKLIIDYKSGKSLRSLAEQYCVNRAILTNLLKENNITIINNRQFDCNENYFNEIDTEEKAYWLGFIATDGGIFGNILTIRLALRDINHLEKFKISIESNNKIYYEEKCCCLRITNKYLIKSLNNLGIIEKKTFTIQPQIVKSYLLKHYWRGCIDGDGWIGTERDVLGFCGNIFMVTKFKEYCYFINGNLKNEIKSRKNIFVFEIYGTNAMAILNNLYYNCNIALERKLNNYFRICPNYLENRNKECL